MDMEAALETFVRGFSYTRSFTHPYEVSRAGNFWIMRDAPRLEQRNAELVSSVIDPDEAVQVVECSGVGRHALCIVTPGERPDDGVKRAYKGVGYRLGRTEGLFVRDLTRDLPDDFGDSFKADTWEGVEELSAAKGKRQMPQSSFEDPAKTVLIFGHRRNGEIAGWVKSVRTSQENCWVSDLLVVPKHRRCGIGRQLMARLLHEDARRGAKVSVLLASHAGAHLYPHLGYERIGTLHLFTPGVTRR